MKISLQDYLGFERKMNVSSGAPTAGFYHVSFYCGCRKVTHSRGMSPDYKPGAASREK